MERPDEEQHEQDTSRATGSDDDSINDPLTQTDADAPQKPFGAGGQSGG